MHRKPSRLTMRVIADHTIHFRASIHRNAELGIAFTGGDFRVGAGFNIRVHTQGNARNFAQAFSNAQDAQNLLRAFGIDLPHAFIQGVSNLTVSLANA